MSALGAVMLWQRWRRRHPRPSLVRDLRIIAADEAEKRLAQHQKPDADAVEQVKRTLDAQREWWRDRR